MLRSSGRLVFFLVCLSILSSIATEGLHRNPHWPTDNEFFSVNQAVEVACRFYPNVEQSLVWALIWEESKYDPLALGRKGEVGLGQLRPATATAFGVQDRTNITENVQALVRHLSHLLTKYRNNIRLVLSAYNSGEPAVDRCHCVPSESRAYVNRIEQSRFFAKHIVEYLYNTLALSTTQNVPVSQPENQLVQLKTSESLLLPILLALFTLAVMVRTAPGSRAVGIAALGILHSWRVLLRRAFRQVPSR